jgi:tRNA(fMet)-specific endonuclease VapC
MDLYLLDTDICSYIMKRSDQRLLDKLRTVELEKIAVSVVTEAELLYGTKLSGKPKQVRASFDSFIVHVRVFDWGREAADHYADIRAQLRRRGEMIGANDLMIAAHARSLGATIITNNEREFRRVKGLAVENWTK